MMEYHDQLEHVSSACAKECAQKPSAKNVMVVCRICGHFLKKQYVVACESSIVCV